MEPLLTTHVGSQGVSVLVDLVRIAWLVATRGRKRKLGYGIEPFLICPVKLPLPFANVVVSVVLLVVRI